MELNQHKAEYFVHNWDSGWRGVVRGMVTKGPLLKLFKERISLLHGPSFGSECLISK